MKRYAMAAIMAAWMAGASPAHATGATRMNDAQVRRAVIRASIARYPGVCACPYNTMRNGRRCGRRSAYSRPGGYSPKCYARDVSNADIHAWRAGHRRR